MSGALRVITPGLFTTVQDLGRPGFSGQGVPRGGAADDVSLRLGNGLVGNHPGHAALEITLQGGAVELVGAMTIAIVGGEIEARVGGREILCGKPIKFPPETVVELGRVTRGARAYVCVSGGLVVPAVMGSASTLAGAGLGGVEGRAVRAGDVIAVGEPPERSTAPPPESFFKGIFEQRTIRAVRGVHAVRFDEAAERAFWESEFVVTPQSDRAGLRLSGPGVESPGGGRMVSEGMMWGAVQVPGGSGGGQPIVLMCDGPTTGGYPVIACVIAADLPVLGQLPPLARVRFEKVTAEEARRLNRERERPFRGIDASS